MLKEFWEAKKHLIQLIGILTGIGALFLSINLPENVRARQALINIQFVWLIVITICLILLFINFIKLSNLWEKDFKVKHSMDFTDTISILITLTLIYLILNLWTYMINLYRDSLWDYFRAMNFATSSFITAIFIHYWRKIVLQIPEKPYYRRVLFSLFAHAIFSVVSGFLIEFTLRYDSFTISNALIFTAVIYIIILIFAIWEKLRIKQEPKIG